MSLKTVKKVKTLEDKYLAPVHVFELSEPYQFYDRSSNFLVGGIYRQVPTTDSSFYLSDEEGNILDAEPVIQEWGLNTYAEIFAEHNFTFIDA